MNRKSLCLVVLAGVMAVAGCGDRSAEVNTALEGIAPGDRVTVLLNTALFVNLSDASGEQVGWQIQEMTGVVSAMEEERLTIAVETADLPDGMAEVLPSAGNRLVVELSQGSASSIVVNIGIKQSAGAEPGVDVNIPTSVLAELYLWEGDERKQLL